MKKYLLTSLGVAWAIMLLFCMKAKAQSANDFQIDMPDIYTASNDTVSRVKCGGYFRFGMYYEICRVQYLVTEVKKNRKTVRWKNFNFHEQVLNHEALELADSSRTEFFKVLTGDTLSFYRSLVWWNPLSYSDVAYFADDTLDYAVELIDSVSNTRVVLLDSVGINSRSTPGTPSIHGTGPLRKLVKYVVPSNLNNTTVMMRLRPYSRGNGAYYFSRLTGRSAGLSDELQNSTIQQWIATTNGYYIQ